MLDPGFLGIDVGSVTATIVFLSNDGAVEKMCSRVHRGQVKGTLRSMIDEVGPVPLQGMGLTSTSPRIVPAAGIIDPQVALIAGSRHLCPDVRSIIFVGGERFGLIRLDEDGRYRGARTNTSCAAGTGSFLDQQARRLGLASSAELARRALASRGEPPRISTRCAVFARTDLVHAQQAGFGIDEICNGLCRGLAQSIADTLFSGEIPPSPVLLAGGVAQNDAVRSHLEAIVGAPLVRHERAPVLGALGAALCVAAGEAAAHGETPSREPFLLGQDVLLADSGAERRYHYGALQFPRGTGAAMPEVYQAGVYAERHPVEVEVFAAPRGARTPVTLGIDIGSTSTKAILIDHEGTPLAGFYTRTLGSPLTAVQAIGASIEARGEPWQITAAAVTGAGRSFIGTVISADLVVDEITAHARAAYQLDPCIDTIIEIGGQDAKFTTMRDGMVTFSHMNTVCAAGTGSFLEEQAERLGCSLADYERLVHGARAPLSSDRCAVFMERDINSFLAQGFATEEILAAALYSVRENYLSKVARGAGIGRRVAFQGATARNKALVAVFEQGLGKPLLVSKYCHLAGALGAALLVPRAAAGEGQGRFVGLAALRADIPVRSETCSLCANHCRLRIATVAGETVAYGFLCGRDYDADRYVEKNRSGFDLMKERRRAVAATRTVHPTAERGPVVGIPAALGLVGTLDLWERFFSLVGIPTVSSIHFTKSVETGRELQGAEFCAPIASLHGHVRHLRDTCDFVFLPFTFEEVAPGEHTARHHCYYTQYSAALVSHLLDTTDRFLMPSVRTAAYQEKTVAELHAALSRTGAWNISRRSVEAAWRTALAERDAAVARLTARFVEESGTAAGPSVVLLGRTYNVLSPEMGKGIPALFGALGVKCFFLDMLPVEPRHVQDVQALLDAVHWTNGAAILAAAAYVARTPGLYPVYITSFKCSPDSFIIEYARRIFDEVGKPWLVLQLDDHDSTLGYQTRIEAAVASFRNHAGRGPAAAADAAGAGDAAGAPTAAAGPGPAKRRALQPVLPVVPEMLKGVEGRTLLFPNWDPFVNPLLCANLRHEGVDARLLAEDDVVIRRAMRHNTGQCLPLTIIMQEAADAVLRDGLDPARTAVWVPKVNLSCNIGMFTPFMKSMLEAQGKGLGEVQVFGGDFYFMDISVRCVVNAYKAYLAGGLLRRAVCRLRPRERVHGSTDRVAAAAMDLLLTAFEGQGSITGAMKAAAELLSSIEIDDRPLPRVAIFGDLYVRDNDIMNQDLVRAIEEAGGEAVTTPYTDYVRIVAGSYFRKMRAEGDWMHAVAYNALWVAADTIGARLGEPFEPFLMPRVESDGQREFLDSFGVRDEHKGESFENLLKIHHIARAYPDLALFVQASPAFCCPSLVTEAMARGIERLTGVPVVSVTYDGTGQYRNDVIAPYLALDPGRRSAVSSGSARV